MNMKESLFILRLVVIGPQDHTYKGKGDENMAIFDAKLNKGQFELLNYRRSRLCLEILHQYLGLYNL